MVKLEWNRINGAKVIDKQAEGAAYIAFENDENTGFVFNMLVADTNEIEALSDAFRVFYGYTQYYLQMSNADMLQHGLDDLDGKGWIIDADCAGIRLLSKNNSCGVTALTKLDEKYARKINLFLSKVETEAQMNDILCSLGDAGGMAFMF